MVALALVGLAGCDGSYSDVQGPPDRAPPDPLPPISSSDARPEPADADPPDAAPDPAPWLRLDHLQMRGTHNSYHRAPAEPLLPEFAFDQPPLAVQLGPQGVRQIELDVHEAGGGVFAVYHVPGIDEESTCPTLRDCLAEVEGWSATHPSHHALFVFIEPKTAFASQADALDRAILDVWPRERIISPGDVRGAHPDLRTAIAVDGWPSVHASRGKALFFLFDDGLPRDRYLAAQPDPLLFVRYPMSDAGAPEAVFFNHDVVDPERFAALAGEGAILRTRGDDAANRARALGSAAHIISLDDADALELPDGTPSRCNPVTAPPECTPALIEPR
ncbi:MAG: hypothetical protein H6701_05290 [Myxococcales bacterium]|nr:hypothetical protein [Myxococcales bacterium]